MPNKLPETAKFKTYTKYDPRHRSLRMLKEYLNAYHYASKTKNLLVAVNKRISGATLTRTMFNGALKYKEDRVELLHLNRLVEAFYQLIRKDINKDDSEVLTWLILQVYGFDRFAIDTQINGADDTHAKWVKLFSRFTELPDNLIYEADELQTLFSYMEGEHQLYRYTNDSKGNFDHTKGHASPRILCAALSIFWEKEIGDFPAFRLEFEPSNPASKGHTYSIEGVVLFSKKFTYMLGSEKGLGDLAFFAFKTPEGLANAFEGMMMRCHADAKLFASKFYAVKTSYAETLKLENGVSNNASFSDENRKLIEGHINAEFEAFAIRKNGERFTVMDTFKT